jgi:hypothetical protein
MVWGFCYLRIFKKMHSISGRSLEINTDYIEPHMLTFTDLSRNQAIQNQRNSFSRGFPLPFNVEMLQAFGALFQIPQYYLSEFFVL